VIWGDSLHDEAIPPDTLKTQKALAAGYSHCLALKTNGTVVGWGSNQYGELDIPPDFTNVVAIAAGSS